MTAFISGVLALAPQPARADQDVRRQRLAGLSNQELAILAPFTVAGPVALVEFADTQKDELPAVNLVVRVTAHPDRVLQVIRNPEHHPRFMDMLDEVTVVQKPAAPSSQGSALIYDWAWDLSLFRLSGRNVMRVYEAPAARPGRGHRITIDSQRGDFGTGRVVMRLLPDDNKGTLLVLSMRLDLRQANYIARKAAGAARSVNRSANMALAYAMALGVSREAEHRQAEHAHPESGSTSPTPTVAQLPPLGPQLWPFTRRGDLVFQIMKNGKVERTGVVGRLGHGQARVRNVLLNVQDFGAALAPGSEAEIVEEHGSWALFDWDLNIPLLGVSGRMRMDRGDRAVNITAVNGALKGGHWQIESSPLPSPPAHPHTLVTAWASFDIRRTNFVVRTLADADPYLGQGITAASQVMLLRALRSRARKAAQLAEREEQVALKKRAVLKK